MHPFQHFYELLCVQHLVECIGLQNISNHSHGESEHLIGVED